MNEFGSRTARSNRSCASRAASPCQASILVIGARGASGTTASTSGTIAYSAATLGRAATARYAAGA